MTDLFTEPLTPVVPAAPDQEADYLEYVKTKFANDKGEIDLAALAKAKYKADQHIAKIEGEQDGLRGELKNRLSFEEMLAKIEAAKNSNAAPANHVETPAQNDDGTKLTADDIKRLMQETLNQETQKATQQKNVEFVRAELTKTLGNDFAPKLKEIAKELEITEDEAGFMAANKPKAFLKLVLGSAPQNSTVNYAPPSNSVRMNTNSDYGVKNNAYYNKIKQTDPATYWSPKVQNELHENARKMGVEAFYKP